MSKSQESFNKKEKEKKRLKKQQDKQLKKEERKANNEKGKGLDEMMAYIDEFGNITTTPPDANREVEEIDIEDIQISTLRKEEFEKENEGEVVVKKGVITFFNEAKGFGFIRDLKTQESIFVHINGLLSKVKENDIVTYDTTKGPKGLNAINVKLFSEL